MDMDMNLNACNRLLELLNLYLLLACLDLCGDCFCFGDALLSVGNVLKLQNTEAPCLGLDAPWIGGSALLQGGSVVCRVRIFFIMCLNCHMHHEYYLTQICWTPRWHEFNYSFTSTLNICKACLEGIFS